MHTVTLCIHTNSCFILTLYDGNVYPSPTVACFDQRHSSGENLLQLIAVLDETLKF